MLRARRVCGVRCCLRRQERGAGRGNSVSWCSFSVMDVPSILQRQVPAVPLLLRAPDAVHR